MKQSFPLLLLCLFLTGCGQDGRLYLPENAPRNGHFTFGSPQNDKA